MAQAKSIDPQEVAHFSKDSSRWWDESGPFAPLHRLNPPRLSYIKSQICGHFGRDEKGFDSLKGLKVLDIGCGGGLVSEPLARLGATVTGIDADAQAVEVAKAHAAQSGLEIEYQNTTAESLLSSFRRKPESTSTPAPSQSVDPGLRRDDGYDVVLALEIIEHVNHVEEFIDTCAKLVKPEGIIIFSTLNRTAKSFALGIVAAEYILRWVPRGTHSWKKFVRPSELAKALRAAGLQPADVTGLVFDPKNSGFSLSQHDIDVNYFMSAHKAGC